MAENQHGNNPERTNPYEDQALIEKSKGDPHYLNRLVGLSIAEAILAEDPNNQRSQELLSAMQQSVQDYEQGNR